MGNGRVVKCKKCGKEWLQLDMTKEEFDHIVNDLQENPNEDTGVCSECGSSDIEVLPNINILWD